MIGYGKTVLLAYGKGSIEKSGLYGSVVELAGVMANPAWDKVQKDAKPVRDHDADLILAVGGGSVIDCAKGISASAYCERDPCTKYWLRFQPVYNRIVPAEADSKFSIAA